VDTPSQSRMSASRKAGESSLSSLSASLGSSCLAFFLFVPLVLVLVVCVFLILTVVRRGKRVSS
jgi:hypothetical protein